MRDLKMDNMKGILIILVVSGHILELFMGSSVYRMLYVLIYLFHMPMFVYCTGYFAKCENVGRRILHKLFLPYVVFQILYLAFEKYLLNRNVSFQFTTPYWLLWYLFAAMVWNLCLPIVAVRSVKGQRIILILSVSAALAAGYADGIGRYLSLSRIIVFFPFFLFGFYRHQWDGDIEREAVVKKSCKKFSTADILLLCLLGVSVIYTFYHGGDWQNSWLYEAESYRKNGYHIGFRSIHLAAAFVVILASRRFLMGRRLPVVTGLGAKTMPIYLFHGFVIRWIGSLSLFEAVKWKGFTAILLVVGILFVFSQLPPKLHSLLCSMRKRVLSGWG